VSAEELLALYRQVDAAYAGASCDASTECCRFGITGREPMVTSVEIEVIERAIAGRGGPLKRRALPIARPSRESCHGVARDDRPGREERVCPLLDASGRCSVYVARPLGCRTFFCDRARLDVPPRAVLLGWSRRVREIAAAHRAGGDVGVRLSSALRNS
jgi:Fe-S-cluster containining protein